MTNNHLYQGETAEYWAGQLHQLILETQENYQRIAAKQHRDNAERTTIFAVEKEDGTIAHEGSDHDTAHLAATMYDNAHIVTQHRTPWKRLPTATHSTEEALATND